MSVGVASSWGRCRARFIQRRPVRAASPSASAWLALSTRTHFRPCGA